MQCPECKFENLGEAAFCSQCGIKMEWVCPDCDFQNLPASRFCCKCGTSLSVDDSPGNDQEAAKSVQQPHPEATTDINSCEAPDSERKCVTVMFSDLTGYTEMSEKLDPEDVKEITGTIFSELTRIIEKYDGFIEKYVGDAILAVFGAKEAFEDSALRAIKAAREIHKHIEAVSPKYEEVIGRKLSMHTGINTGLVVTGEINYQKGTHGLVGDTINTAARLMSASQAGEIIVDRDSFIQTQGYFEFEILEPLKAKGKAEPIKVYRVGDALQTPKKLHRLHGLRAALIGRSIEMQVLKDAAESLERGKGSVVSVCGTAGTGKSRLIHELKKTLDFEKYQWFDGNAYPYTQTTPYFPLIDLLTKAFGIKEADNSEAIKMKVESSLESLLGIQGDRAQYIGGLFSIKFPETSEVSPEYWKDQLYSSVEDVLKALSTAGPTVICLEDIHWADPSTMELVRKLVSNLSIPLMIICLYRPVITIFTDLEIKTLSIEYTELRLQELSPSESHDMVCSLLKADKIPKRLRGFIRDNIGGNPFYVEELINALIDSEALSKKSGQWVLSKAIDDSFISTNIQGVIAGRIDRLGRNTKRILQEASVIGRAFLFDILNRISEIKQDIDKNLVMLERLDLISARSIQPSLEYIFKHALTQEIVYNGLVKSERRAIHEKIGNVIEILFKDRLSDFYETLAYHFSKGVSINKAISYFMKSGEKGLRKFALAEAHQSYEKAYDLLISTKDQVADRNLNLILLINKWSFVFYYYADWGGWNRLLSKHEDMALQLEDRSATAMFLAWFGWSHLGIGKPTIGEKYLSRAYDMSRSIQNQEIMAYVHTWRCWSLVSLGRFDNAIEDGEKALSLAQKYDLGRYIHFKTRAGMANAYWYQGDRLKSFEKGQELVAFGEQHGSIPSLTFGYLELGASFILDGDYTKALEWLNRGTSEQKDFIYYYACLVMKGMVFFLLEKYDEAVNILRPNIEFLNQNSRFPWLAVPGELFLGGSLVGLGSFDAGFKIIQEARKKLNEMHYSYFYIVSELMLGSIFTKIVSREADVKLSIIFRNIGFMLKNIASASKNAETHFRNAIGLAKEIGAKGIEGQAWLELGKLYVVKNKKVDARQAVNSSIEIFRLCNIDTHRRQAEKVLNSIDK